MLQCWTVFPDCVKLCLSSRHRDAGQGGLRRQLENARPGAPGQKGPPRFVLEGSPRHSAWTPTREVGDRVAYSSVFQTYCDYTAVPAKSVLQVPRLAPRSALQSARVSKNIAQSLQS